MGKPKLCLPDRVGPAMALLPQPPAILPKVKSLGKFKLTILLRMKSLGEFQHAERRPRFGLATHPQSLCFRGWGVS